MTQQTISSTPVDLSADNSLLVAVLLAVVVHIVIMVGVSIPKPELGTPSRDIDITLIDTPSIQAPEQNQFLAQENQLGQAQQVSKPEPVKAKPAVQKTSPQVTQAKKPQAPSEKPESKPQDKRIIKTPPEQSKPVPQEKRMIKTPPEQIKPEPQEKPMTQTELEPVEPVAQVKAVITAPEKAKPMLQEQVLPKDLFQESKPDPKEQKTATPEKHHPISAASLQQQITEQATEASQQPASAAQTKSKHVNQVSSHKFVAAQYLKDWETKVEKVGNINYPVAATKPGFSASLTMEVAINAEGGIDSMRITQSSGNLELDESAKKIVRMSAPFPPLPSALRSELDVLLITRSWKFSDESGLITQ